MAAAGTQTTLDIGVATSASDTSPMCMTRSAIADCDAVSRPLATPSDITAATPSCPSGDDRRRPSGSRRRSPVENPFTSGSAPHVRKTTPANSSSHARRYTSFSDNCWKTFFGTDSPKMNSSGVAVARAYQPADWSSNPADLYRLVMPNVAV